MSKKSGTKSQKRPFLFEEILRVLKKNASRSYNYKQIASALNAEDKASRELLLEVLEELEKRNIIESPERGKYRIKPGNKHITGTVDLTSSGAAYIISADSEQDIYVAPRNTHHALQGDTVRVQLYPRRKGQNPEGEIAEIIKRAKDEFVGVVQVSPRYVFLVPDNPKMIYDIFIPPKNSMGVKNGQKAIARITEWPEDQNNPAGEIIEVLGDPGENDVEMHAILAEYGLPYSFPADVERIADLIPTAISEDEISYRRDFRDVVTFTIDPEDAKDFDDALSIRKLENGNWEVGVHIADVSHYVKEGSLIDKEAISRGTSVYLVDRVVPMLPEILSNNVCSLRPHEDKLCFSAVFEMDENAALKKEWFGKTIIHSDHRFTYEQAQQVIETGKGEFSREILMLDSLSKKLREERFRKGSIAFDKEEVKFQLDEKGNPTGVYFKHAKDSNKLIEDFMLLANRKVAEFAGKGKTGKTARQPYVYRVHDAPDPEKLKSLAEFVKRFGYRINTGSYKTISSSLNSMLEQAAEQPHAHIVETLTIRSMAKAVYSAKNIGHYGLAFTHYTHFTSPIRRYPDVLAHRLLFHYLRMAGGEKNLPVPLSETELEDLCKHSSERERLAAEAERASIKYKQVQFMEDKIGKTFEGIISGVTEWGLYIEIIENKCEGMIRLKDMMDDHYIYDEENYRVYGRKKNTLYALGDKVLIKVKRVDLLKKQLDFILVD